MAPVRRRQHRRADSVTVRGGAPAVVGAVVAATALASCSAAPASSTTSPGLHPFDSYRVQGRQVVVAFTGIPDQPGPCGADYRARASETVDRVYIRLRELPHAGPGGDAACPAIAQLRSVTVTLESPLGSRAVVDGATGDIVLQPRPTAPPPS